MAVKGIRWGHDRDVVEARIGRPLRWGRPRPDGIVRGWATGGTVTAIERGPGSWLVYFAPGEEGGWSNPVWCGDEVEEIEE